MPAHQNINGIFKATRISRILGLLIFNLWPSIFTYDLCKLQCDGYDRQNPQ